MHRRHVAAHFGVTPRTLDNWVRAGKFPPPTPLPNGRPGWSQDVVFAATKHAASAAA
jgi:predicted DNA-binding transcriptional regulator AlpA